MIYITGDTRGDFRNVARFCEKMQTNKDDVLIILGDADVNYYGGEQDVQKKKYLESLPITIKKIDRIEFMLDNFDEFPQADDSWDDFDWCYECSDNGDDFYTDENGEQVWRCLDCPFDPLKDDE